MVKQIKKITMLLFVAATMFTFASCNKNDDNNGGSGSGGSSSISEAKLIGATFIFLACPRKAEASKTLA